MTIQEMLGNKNLEIIDVRSPGEFMQGHVAGSLNIPLNQIPQRINEIKNIDGPKLLVCASGNRSGQAEQFLRTEGIEDVYNAGSWSVVKMHRI